MRRRVKRAALTFLVAVILGGCSLMVPSDQHYLGGGGSTGEAGTGCPSGQKLCSGQCVSTSDPATGCGASACTACSLPNATAKCVAGACAVDRCSSGWTDCDGVASNGCEANLDQDASNCGACGENCGSLSGVATAHCAGGVCVIDTCSSGTGDCDGVASNGCEANLDQDASNCGACGKVCKPPLSGVATGKATCSSGQCSAQCNQGSSLCSTSNGPACVQLQKDPLFCGSCTTSCPAGTPCVAGACTASGCAFGQLMCTAGCANPASDPISCGICDAPCGAGEVCSFSTCTTGCAAGLTTCNVSGHTACVNLSKDPDHCGACGTPCAAGKLCDSGKCIAYRFATGCWQCGLDNVYPTCCTVSGQTVCLPAGATCP